MSTVSESPVCCHLAGFQSQSHISENMISARAEIGTKGALFHQDLIKRWIEDVCAVGSTSVFLLPLGSVSNPGPLEPPAQLPGPLGRLQIAGRCLWSHASQGGFPTVYRSPDSPHPRGACGLTGQSAWKERVCLLNPLMLFLNQYFPICTALVVCCSGHGSGVELISIL